MVSITRCLELSSPCPAQQTHQINTSPPLVRPRIHHPQLRKGIAPARLRAIHAVGREAEVVEGRREEVGKEPGRVAVLEEVGGGDVGEEAVVEEATLEDEVAEGVRKVPDEEEAEGGRGGLWEGGEGGGVGGEDDGEGREEGEDGGLIEEVGGEGGGGGGCWVGHGGDGDYRGGLRIAFGWEMLVLVEST